MSNHGTWIVGENSRVFIENSAESIIRTVNTHDALIRALQGLVDYHEGDYERTPEVDEAIKALAVAKGETP